jgi:hypothetical protein
MIPGAGAGEVNQYLIYQSSMISSGSVKKTENVSTQVKSLPVETLNRNLEAMRTFYSEGQVFTELEIKTDNKSTETKKGNAADITASGHKTGVMENAPGGAAGTDPKKGTVNAEGADGGGKDPKEDIITEQLKNDSKAYEAYQKMTPEEQKQFMSLAKNNYLDACKNANGEDVPPRTNRNLLKLMNQNKLLNKDSQGNSLLNNLNDLQNQKFVRELSGKNIMAQTLYNLANPELIQQGNRNTCTATSVEYLNAKNSPAEYTRIIAGLTSEKGEVKLQNGDTLKRDDGNPDIGDKGCLPPDDSGRIDIDRIYQSSLMEYANGDKKDYVNNVDDLKPEIKQLLNYDSQSEYSSRDTNIKTNDDGTKSDNTSGLATSETDKALSAIIGENMSTKTIYDKSLAPVRSGSKNVGLDQAKADIEKQLQDGKEVPVGVNLEEDPAMAGNHQEVLVKMDGDNVTLKDPQNNQYETMSKDEFFNKYLRDYTTPDAPDATKNQSGT